MRNLVEYPITVQEIVDALQTESDKLAAEERCGDMRPLLFRIASQIVERTDIDLHGLGVPVHNSRFDPLDRR